MFHQIKTRTRHVVAAVLSVAMFAGLVGTSQAEERRWTFQFDDIFKEGTKPLLIYAREVDGKWITCVGSSRDPSRPGVKKTYNRSWYYADMSQVPITDGKMQGTITVHMTPDLWVPLDHRSYTIELKIDAALMGADTISGNFEIQKINTRDASAQNMGRNGKVNATVKLEEQPSLPESFTLTCNMQGSLVGGDPAFGDRCMMLALGVENGKLVSTAHATMDKKSRATPYRGFQAEGNFVQAERDRFAARISVPAKTLDMEPCTYVFDIDGHFYDIHIVGVYALTVVIDGKPDISMTGSFDGRVDPGVQRHEVQSGAEPWHVPVAGFKTVKRGEHPRLLFRKSDLPALRRKMKTPEGQAILKRLRYLLDGDQGETMTAVFSPATHAYMGGGYKSTTFDKPGVFTIGHVAGYGLLYQLTGDQKYAEFGRQCFEESLAGKRDRDDRYSFRGPGGPLRAGPSLGWHAVGYDLCYDGWDAKTREKFGRAIAEYAEGSSTNKEKKKSTLQALARGTMPPASNHFGMQVGGAALALLAVDGESFVDQERIDRLLRVAEDSMVRNLRDGFGDGGFFKEGDGTGSMASQIAFLTALQAWQNAKGMDFMNIDRPNARMMALKWIYLTVVRDGRPDVWPVRGSYGHNVWARQGVSGMGYFGINMGPLDKDDRAAMKWFYNRFLEDADAEQGGPYDTVAPYPHAAVCSFVSWPTGLRERNPADILPLCYRDSDAGFYAWRNRWEDANDTVISVLTNRTSGYMSASPDRALKINSMGKHLSWGTVKDGPARHWSMSPRGETSSLTLADGTCFGVDFTGASSANVMLVTTGKADGTTVKVGGKALTFAFPTSTSPPKVTSRGESATIGRQRVTIEEGNLVFTIKRRSM